MTLEQMRDQISSANKLLSADVQSQQTVDNLVYGTGYQTRIANFGWTQGPVKENVSSTLTMVFDLYVPDWVLKILRCQVRIVPRAQRKSAAGVVGNEAAHTHAITTPTGTNNNATGAPSDNTSDGPSATIQVGTDGHIHIWGDFDSSEAAGGTSRKFQDGNANRFFWTPTSTVGDLETGPTIGSASAATGTHTHGMKSHTHLLGSHSHSITTPTAAGASHTHSFTAGALADSGAAAGIRFTLDAIDRSAALGGPWDATVVFEIKQYLVDSVFRPVTGYHPVILSSTADGAIEVYIDWVVIAKPVRSN